MVIYVFLENQTFWPEFHIYKYAVNILLYKYFSYYFSYIFVISVYIIFSYIFIFFKF